VAYAHHNSNRNVLDEWVFRLEGTNPSTKRQTGEGVTPSPVCSEKRQIATLNLKNIFLIFSLLLKQTYLLLDAYTPLS